MTEQSTTPGNRRTRRLRTSLYAMGEPMIWFSGGALLLCICMIVGLLLLVFAYGASTFWPLPVVKLRTQDGVFMGEITREETFKPQPAVLAALTAVTADRAREEMAENDGVVRRRLVRTGNFKLTETHFKWVSDFAVTAEEKPPGAIVVERREWGRFYGMADAFVLLTSYVDAAQTLSADQKKAEVKRRVAAFAPVHGGKPAVIIKTFADGREQEQVVPPDKLDTALDILAVAEVVEGGDKAWELFEEYRGPVTNRYRVRRDLEKYDTGEVNAKVEAARLEVRESELELLDVVREHGKTSAEYREAQAALMAVQKEYEKRQRWAGEEFSHIREKINDINRENGRYRLLMKTAGEGERPPALVLMKLENVVRAYRANQLTTGDKLGIYASRWWEYLTDEPREANSEGGVFPAIFGTVIMTLLMALAVVPFGVLASLYLREYAKAGPVVSAVRIAVNNLAGVPSIVYGVFGLGFFCYGVGGFIDGGPSYVLPKPTWFLVLGGMVLVAITAVVSLVFSISRPGEAVTLRRRILRWVSIVLWLASSLALVVLIATTPFYDGFYRAALPNPTFGKGALIWASLTLALMTLPVIIVATEEALSAVPNSMREGSYACGAGKWQTIRRIVMPRAMPGIMTGMILAMARGAGEVAPLMLVGAVKLAPELPFSSTPPFGINRSFMHLGFHIYDVGFQSQNSEAAKPMVYTTTLLLICIVAILNLAAIWLRTRLRRRFVSDQF